MQLHPWQDQCVHIHTLTVSIYEIHNRDLHVEDCKSQKADCSNHFMIPKPISIKRLCFHAGGGGGGGGMIELLIYCFVCLFAGWFYWFLHVFCLVLLVFPFVR